jgi:hypothetical protein
MRTPLIYAYTVARMIAKHGVSIDASLLKLELSVALHISRQYTAMIIREMTLYKLLSFKDDKFLLNEKDEVVQALMEE